MFLSKSKVKLLIEEHFNKNLTKECYEIEEIPAVNLLVGSRFDLAFKIFYLEMLYKDVPFASKVYKEHIRAFSLGRFIEFGNDNKKSINDFYDSFYKTFTSIRQSGFDETKTVVPLSNNGVIVNGAHRVASAIILDKDVSCVTLDLPQPNYGYKFFHDRNVSTEILDIAATTFVKHAKNIYIALIWPAAKGYEKEVERTIPNVVYKKDIDLNHNGAHNLLSQVYIGERWIGNVQNNFKGVEGKLVKCFGYKKARVKVIAFQAANLEEVLNIKNEIRAIFNIGKNSIHITDTRKEAIYLSKILFNKNSVHFLNYAKPNSFLSIHSELLKIKKIISTSKINSASIVLNDEFVLAAYGIRGFTNYSLLKVLYDENEDSGRIHDIDLFYKGDCISSLYDPSCYFYFQGLKFKSFESVLTHKKKSNKELDSNDAFLMSIYVKGGYIKGCLSETKQWTSYKVIILKSETVKLLKKLNLYKSFRCLYKFFKG